MNSPQHRAPSGLGRAGKRLWRTIKGDFELDSRQLLVLEQAARQADALAELEDEVARSGVVASGSRGQLRLSQAVVELRQGRIALSRLLGELSLPEKTEESDLQPVPDWLRDEARDDLLAGRAPKEVGDP